MVNAIFRQEGEAIDYTPATALEAGAIVSVGGLIGITKNPIAAATLGALATVGVYDFIKDGTSGPVFEIGDDVFWDPVTLLAVRTGGWYLGTAVAAAATGDAFVKAKLIPRGLPSDVMDLTYEDVTLASGSKTLDIEDVGKVMNVTVGHATNVVTLPSVAAGLAFVIRCGATGQRVAVSPQAIDKIMGPDLAGVDNKDRILAAATSQIGDYVSLEYGSADGWLIRSQRGIWTNEP